MSSASSFLTAACPVTAAYHDLPRPPSGLRGQGFPAFNLHIAEAMRFDPQVRIGLGARNGLLAAAQVEVVAESAEIAAWVQAQWDRIWSTSAHQLLRAKLYGFVPLEVMYRQVRGGPLDGAIEFDHLLDRHPRDARILVHDGGPVGFALQVDASPRRIEVLAPKALLCTFDSECGNPYGTALLERAYPAWYEKWMEGGAKKTLRLRMVKDAYIGDILWYPPDRTVQLASGESISWRDIARQMVESRQSGGALTLPLLYDRDGRRLIDYTPPQDVGGATQIFAWKRDVDLEIWKALEVPPEVIEASAPGSGYAGRTIPFIVALSAVQYELAEILRCVDRDILRPLVHLNFGCQPRHELRPRSLVDTYFDRLHAGPTVRGKDGSPAF